jgi:thioredoxin-related protein
MKKLIIILLLFPFADSTAQSWITDLQVALREANEQNKKVLLYFSVPEACDRCIDLEKNVFSSGDFKKFASDNYILAKADFSGEIDPRTKQENLLIVEKYNKDGFFPLVVILDGSSKVLGKIGIYNNEPPSTYIAHLQAIVRH